MSSHPSSRTDSDVHVASDDVAVVITTYNDAEYLTEALASVRAQSYPVREVIVVDDGSSISPAAIVQAYRDTVLIRKSNGGLSSARNAGLRFATAGYICFLDADDRLTHDAIALGLESLRMNPDVAFTYGGHRRIRANGSIAGPDIYHVTGSDPYAALLERNLIGMHATVLYRRELLTMVGGFDENLPRCEDYDLYLRLARNNTIASHPEVVAEYRWHGQNMSRDTEKMLETALLVHGRHRPVEEDPRFAAWKRGRRIWTDWYRGGQQSGWEQFTNEGAPIQPRLTRLYGGFDSLREGIRRHLPAGLAGWPPPRGKIHFGSLNSTTPASKDFGWDRGTPVDRYYIERFLAANAGDIHGRVLEVGDDAYSQRFGGDRVTHQDVLHVSLDHPKATLMGDLTVVGTLPENAFDCILVTQTLQMIFDLQAAATRLVAALKPGGVLLLTVPGISQVDRLEWKDSWYWSLTRVAVERLFVDHVLREEMEVKTFGNVFAAVSFLFGAALEEVDASKLDETDPAYPVIVTLRARKPK